jgi:hypothetical protein
MGPCAAARADVFATRQTADANYGMLAARRPTTPVVQGADDG